MLFLVASTFWYAITVPPYPGPDLQNPFSLEFWMDRKPG